MRTKINNSNFFKKNKEKLGFSKKEIDRQINKEATPNNNLNDEYYDSKIAPLLLDEKVIEKINEAVDFMNSCEQYEIASKITNLKTEAVRERFSIAVVGEFSRGKSSFINKLLEKEYLPVGDLPTTAILTRIRNNKEEKLLFFDENGQKKATTPISMKVWEKISDENLNEQKLKGTVLMGVRNKWLAENNIEIFDTPGAGDLEETRALMIGDALQRCDGAIITISATSALSLSEKLFIEQRILTRKMPFLMILITKLDMIREKERLAIINHINEKLKLWNINIPVFCLNENVVPYEIDKSRVGIKAIKEHIASWINDPSRKELTEIWLLNQVKDYIVSVVDLLREQKYLAEKNEEERRTLIQQKKQALINASISWEELRMAMFKRFDKVYDGLKKKIESSSNKIIEKLLYELSHSQNPTKWLKDDYPYRLKIELANVASSIERGAAYFVTEDAKWFNGELTKHFKTHVSFKMQSFADEELYGEKALNTTDIEFEDLEKKKEEMVKKNAAISIGSYFLLSAIGLGGLGILATLGVGTGVKLVADKQIKGEIEKQREAIAELIRKDVPDVLENAMQQSEKRLKAVYEEIINASNLREKVWIDAQNKIIENSVAMTELNPIVAVLPKLETFLNKL